MYVEMNSVQLDKINKGDKIVLKGAYGPEGAVNFGIVHEKRSSGVLTDFGLTYKYVIPIDNIKKHFRLKEQNVSNKLKNQIKL